MQVNTRTPQNQSRPVSEPARGSARPALCCPQGLAKPPRPVERGFSGPWRERYRPPHPGAFPSLLSQPRSTVRPSLPAAVTSVLNPSSPLPSHSPPPHSLSAPDFYSIHQTAIFPLNFYLLPKHYTNKKGRKNHPQCHCPVASTALVALRPSRPVRALSAVIPTELWSRSACPDPQGPLPPGPWHVTQELCACLPPH